VTNQEARATNELTVDLYGAHAPRRDRAAVTLLDEPRVGTPAAEDGATLDVAPHGSGVALTLTVPHMTLRRGSGTGEAAWSDNWRLCRLRP